MNRPMQGRVMWFLVVYLFVLFVVLGAWAWSLWDARPPEPPASTWISGPPPATPAQGPPVIDSIHPDTLTYGVGSPVVWIFGSGFDASSRILLDGVVKPGGRFVSHDRMVLELGEGDFRRSGPHALTVVRGELASGAHSVIIASDASVSVAWDPPLFPEAAIGVEERLALLSFLLGAWGAVLASFHSLSNYRGEGRLGRSWALYYLASPVLGGGTSLVLYLVVRAGFLSGTNIQMEPGATPMGLLAISVLSGLFYDKTLMKLREVFITAFNPRDDRSGKLRTEQASDAADTAPLAIETASLPHATHGVAYGAQLAAGGGQPTYSWKVKPPLPGGLRLDPLAGRITGVPTEASPKTTYAFEVKDMRRASARVALALEVK